MSPRITAIHKAVEHSEQCRATHVESSIVHERFGHQTVWQGIVETFDLEAHPKAKRAYAWMRPEDQDNEPQYTVVLEIPPVESPQTAVKVAIAAKGRQ